MATHSSILAMENPMEPGGLESMGSQRVGYDLEANSRSMQTESITIREYRREFLN